MLIQKIGHYTIYISEKNDLCATTFCIEQGFWSNKQVHGDRIIKITNPNNFKNRTEEADGIVTNICNQKIGVRLADCNGIIVMGKEWFGIVHVGRRGLINGIIKKCIDMIIQKGEDAPNINVFIGPSIRSCCYEVGQEFKDIFDSKYLVERGDKLYLDMIKYLKDKLEKIGIQETNIHIYPTCTHCTDQFFSYRKGNKGQRIIVGVEKNNQLSLEKNN